MNQIVKSAVFCLCAMMACVLMSCDEIVSIQQAYKFGITTLHGSGNDLWHIEEYLESKGVKNDDIIITEGKSTKDCDAKAEKVFNETVAKLSHAELEAILGKTCYFKYTATRYAEDGKTVITIGSWSYPAE